MNRYSQLLKSLVAISVLAAVAGFLFWRAPYGYADLDECFPIAVCHRLRLGDALIVDERFGAQFSQLVLYPFFLIRHAFAGSLDGILLASRQFFALIMLATGVFHFCTWRKTDFCGALLGAATFALFAPFSIMLFTYYSIEVMAGSVILSLLIAKPFSQNLRSFIVGFFIALIIMANPYAILAYPAYSIFELCIGRAWKRWLCITLGCASLGIPVLIFLFSRAPAADVLASLKFMLDDPGHPKESLALMLQTWWRALINQQGAYTWHFIAFVGILPGLLAIVFQKFFEPRKLILHAWSTLAGLAWIYFATFKSVLRFPDYAMTPLAFVALGFVLTSSDRKIRINAILAFIATLLVNFASCCASNQDRIRVATCMAIFCPIALPWMWSVAREAGLRYRWAGYTSRALVAVFSLVSLAAVAFLRFSVVFWEPKMTDPNAKFDVSIPDGAHAGIITSKFKYEKKHKRIKDNIIKILEHHDAQKILCPAGNPLCYLFAEREICGYTAWMAERDPNTFDKLSDYYSMRPHKIPDLIILTQRDDNLLKSLVAIGYKQCDKYLDAFPVLERADATWNQPEHK